ncbi:MAG: hypothetical protein KY454_02200 [Actinobacteria bacterium]|nr:hypothetical protein [Actinomycetota bacterium]MBW3650894.1 hypothetical protein [Actinomycetota bacterium]
MVQPVNSGVTADSARQEPSPRKIERALRDLVPATLAAGAAAVAVAVAVGGSTARLHVPFIPRLGPGEVTSSAAPSQAAKAEVSVRLGPKASRRPAAVVPGLVAQLLASPVRPVAPVVGSGEPLIFGPVAGGAAQTFVSPAVVVGGDLEQVVPTPEAPPPSVGAPFVVSQAPAPPPEVGTQSVRPRRVKAPKAGRPEAEAAPDLFQAASLSSPALLSGSDSAPADEEGGGAKSDDAKANNPKGNGKGHDHGQDRSQGHDDPPGHGQPRPGHKVS